MKLFVSGGRVGASVVAVALGLAALGAAPTARAQTASLVMGGGGAAGFGMDMLPPGDDESSRAIDLTSLFPGGLLFNGERYTFVFVNNNGNVSFGAPLSDYTPVAFPGAPRAMVAAWWGDVDTRQPDPPKPDAGVYWHVGASEFVATWYQVGYFDRHFDRRNSFQLILRPAPGAGTIGDFDIELRYNRCEWTTGDASGGDAGAGGVPARAGYDAPPSEAGGPASSTLPGSGTPEVLELCTRSNVDDPGVWELHVRGGTVALCGNGVPEPGEECDGRRVPAGFGCTADCLLCGGDSGRACEAPDAGRPDAAVDASTPEAGPDVVAVDAGVDASALPDASLDARDAGTTVVTAYGGGGLIRCASAPGNARAGSRAGLVALLGVLAGVRAGRRRRRRGEPTFRGAVQGAAPTGPRAGHHPTI